MKLIETPINHNLNLETFYPNITKYLFNHLAMKHYKLYALDRTQIIYVDAFDKIIMVLINDKKKISREEVDIAIHRLMHSDRQHVKVTVGLRQKMEERGISLSKPRKDIILVEMLVQEQ